METQKNVKETQKQIKNICSSDKDIFTQVLENQSSEYISNIYFEFEKNNSIADIFAVKEKSNLSTKLKSKKICS